MQFSRSSFILATVITASLFSNTLTASECSHKSGKNRAALIELYTSEGCSSCPPADKWLSQLSKRGIGLDKLVPLSLHVDYWNYIGWRDPYSAPEYTQRQREIGQRNKLRSIYTPQMVFNGRDYRGWRRQNVTQLLKEVNAWPAGANLSFNWSAISNNELTATVKAELTDKNVSPSTMYVALYENNLTSNITAGENDGRSLHHDYVVRKMLAIPVKGKQKITKDISFQLEHDWDQKNLGMAVFVQQHSDGSVLQALSGSLSCQS